MEEKKVTVPKKTPPYCLGVKRQFMYNDMGRYPSVLPHTIYVSYEGRFLIFLVGTLGTYVCT